MIGPRAPRLARIVLAVLLAALASGCGGAATSGPADGRPAVATPLPSLTATLSATAALLRDGLERAGFGLEQARVPVRPSEPASLVMTPRAALRATLADPDEGFVIVYDLADTAEAQARAEDLAAYLESGFGQSNFTADTRLSVAVVEDTLVFAWWAPSRSSDPDAGQAAFDAIASVGIPVEIAR